MSSYIHGSDPAEQARLSKLNDLLNARCMRLMGIAAGEKILDVGSGLGQFTLAMAAKSGSEGKTVGVERDDAQRETANRNMAQSALKSVEFRSGLAENLPLHTTEWNTFDLAHARFILEHVNQPAKVVEQMTKAVRPGGKVVLVDDDHVLLQLYPEPEGFRALWDAYMKSYEVLGNDPLIGRKLVSLLHDAGLHDIRTEVVFFGDNATSPNFNDYAINLMHILRQSKDIVIREKLITTSAFESGMSNLDHWSRRPDAAIWYVANWAEGRKQA